VLVYGDARSRVPTERLVARLREGRDRLSGAPAAERRSLLSRMLLDAGELTQGLLDADFKRRGADAQSVLRVLLARLGAEIAAAFVASLHPAPADAQPLGTIDELSRARLPATVGVTAPEGYAFYALYPELYTRAAAVLRARKQPGLRVIGIRSIGASLAPIVAASAGGVARTTLVRPVGHPFARALAVAEDLARDMLSDASCAFAIVDDGPDASGSSFGAVGDWLERRGVASERVWYLASHDGPLGPRASEKHRARWASARRVVASGDEAFFRSVIGEAEAPLRDVGGGRWRAFVYAAEAEWPPVNATLERKKLLVGEPDQGRMRLYKFAGLGRYGDEKLARAEILARAGMVPTPLGLHHGFLATDWLAGTRLPFATPPRTDVVEALARYLAELAATFPAPPGREGASSSKLLAMAKHNASEALGPAYARELDRHAENTGQISRRARHVLTDNRTHAWEWLVLPDGRVLKCDALDHHAGHDLVGAQDIAWDVAGASVELELGEAEVARVVDHIGRRAGARAAPGHLGFFTDAYLAFQMGAFTLAQEQTQDAAELVRLREAARRYSERLRRRIET
jgi:hypothetical protein